MKQSKPKLKAKKPRRVEWTKAYPDGIWLDKANSVVLLRFWSEGEQLEVELSAREPE